MERQGAGVNSPWGKAVIDKFIQVAKVRPTDGSNRIDARGRQALWTQSTYNVGRLSVKTLKEFRNSFTRRIKHTVGKSTCKKKATTSYFFFVIIH